MFNIYLKILQGVDVQVFKALGRMSPHWQARHSYLYYQHKVPGEIPLPISLIGILNRNQSLKCAQFCKGLNTDPRTFVSDYYITEDMVN